MPSITVLGFDFGTKRIGLAIGQWITGTASPLCVLATQSQAIWETIHSYIETWQPSHLLVGAPYSLTGEDQKILSLAKAFANDLETRFHLPVVLVDERYTTKAARSLIFSDPMLAKKYSEQVDAYAAKLIIEDWLRKQG